MAKQEAILVTVYLANIQKLRPYYHECLYLISSKRRDTLLRYHSEEDKLRKVAAGLLYRKYLHVIDEHEFIYGANGKSYLQEGKSFFNLSESGDYVAIALSNQEIGIDIEKIVSVTDMNLLAAERIFTPNECLWMRETKTQERFFYLWTQKESILKAGGRGFFLDPKAVDNFGESWHTQSEVFDNHIICCAARVQLAMKIQVALIEELVQP